MECAIATHNGISDGADGDGNESEPDGYRTKLQSDLGDIAGSFKYFQVYYVSFLFNQRHSLRYADVLITQETTARLLFMAVRWVRCLPPFQTISKDDQLLLLERSWTQLFLLHLAQWSVSWDITALLEDEQVRGRLPTDDNLTNQELVLIQVYRSYLPFVINHDRRRFEQIIFSASTNAFFDISVSLLSVFDLSCLC